MARGITYERCSEWERRKAEEGFKRIKKYRYFYLMGKYDREGKLLYKECFSRFDIEGVPNAQLKKERKPHSRRGFCGSYKMF